MEVRQPITAVIFDMDGVLFDTEPMHMEAWLRVLEEVGISHAYGREFFDNWVGKADETLGRFLEEKHSRPGQVLSGAYHVKKGRHFRDILKAELVSFPGVEEGLARLAKILPLAVATTSHRVDLELMLAITGLGRFFQAACAYDDVDNHKPHPEPYLYAAERLRVAPEDCVALEDSPNGVNSARAAGMLTLGIKSTFDTETLKAADYIFDTTVAAIDWLEAQLRAKRTG